LLARLGHHLGSVRGSTTPTGRPARGAAAIAAVALVAEHAAQPVEQPLVARIAAGGLAATRAGRLVAGFTGGLAVRGRAAIAAVVLVAEHATQPIQEGGAATAGVAGTRLAATRLAGGLAGGLAASRGATGRLTAIVALAALHPALQPGPQSVLLTAGRTTRLAAGTATARPAVTTATGPTINRGSMNLAVRGNSGRGRSGGGVGTCQPHGSHHQKSSIHSWYPPIEVLRAPARPGGSRQFHTPGGPQPTPSTSLLVVSPQQSAPVQDRTPWLAEFYSLLSASVPPRLEWVCTKLLRLPSHAVPLPLPALPKSRLFPSRTACDPQTAWPHLVGNRAI
jgi:hypothetical protein